MWLRYPATDAEPGLNPIVYPFLLTALVEMMRQGNGALGGEGC